ncbi:hypothetical protein [Elizabethkingia anophelis]|uniref:hypothetical protein n=1 Tax=Elizabethkingia anophelis TaxID=1117645 RepID=UPI0013197519|nr:hypothetical protein [Elizabethkingia anophelis]MBE9393713.1 hypothetical protein [Elizabethkingia anophelis]MBE9405686.1 hypothetical protein [Elizabethkingia anophelis]BBQ07559.1 hypothetical protein JUNP353_2130 [Elizabethkingia anophelis]
MKKLLLLLIFPVLLFSQTTLKEADIYAAAGNRFETLLTNIEAGDNFPAVSSLLDKIGLADDETYKTPWNQLDQRWRYKQKIVSGNEKPAIIYVRWTGKWVNGYKQPIITKVELTGDTTYIVRFYINFWSRAINFRDTKPGETVTTRFLSDVAALSVGTNGQSKIVVTPAKDYYKN